MLKNQPSAGLAACAATGLAAVALVCLTCTGSSQQPAPASGDPAFPQSTNLLVKVDAKGNYTLGQTPVTVNQLRTNLMAESAKHPELRLEVQADKRAPIKAVMKVVDLMKDAGIGFAPHTLRTSPPVPAAATGATQYVALTAQLQMLRWSSWGMIEEGPWEVRCIVGTNSWRMDGRFLEGAKSSAWFTGTNIIQNHELPKSVIGDQQVFDYVHGQDRFFRVVTSSGQRWTTVSASVDGNPGRPIHQADLLTVNGRIAWLAFCSGPCLKREGRKLYPPRDLWKEVVNAPGGFSDQTAVFEDRLGLPKSIRLELPNHSPVLQYGIVGSTNVFGWEFPLGFYLAQYRPATTPGPNQIGPDGWEVDFVVRGRVTAIGAGSRPDIPPGVTAALNK